MRIGLDIDDTISNTHFILMKYAYKYNAENGNDELLKYNTNDFTKIFGWDDEKVYNFFRTYYLDALKEIEPKFGVKETLTKLKKDGHEIIFITIRDDNECGGEGEAYRLTYEWLKKYEIPYDELNVAISNKKDFCSKNNIDIFMDDSEKTCKAVSELGIKTFIAMNPYNLEFKDDNIINIYSMNEFYNEVLNIQKSRH
ncbi:MAG: hypothetical protein IJS47_00945 [Clostridia bacterium]|nr:hypothetical protein [Clostridia bacterium]